MAGRSRRRFLVSGLIALVAGASGLWWLRRADRFDPPPCLAQLVPDRSQARDLARGYLQAAPAEANVDALAERIFAGRRFRSRDECAAFLRERIGSDYRERETRRVDGFVVSVTELRLYALRALLGRSS